MKALYFLAVLGLIVSCDSGSSSDSTLKSGKAITEESFEVLGGALKMAMKEGGVKNAIAFCNLNALPLTDQLSDEFNVEIKRTALQVRNEQNSPDSLELIILSNYQKELKAGVSIAPQVISVNGKERYFSPIITNGLCLSCHGMVGSQIKDSDYAIIKEKYPKDNAIGFLAGDLRCIWSIQF